MMYFDNWDRRRVSTAFKLIYAYAFVDLSLYICVRERTCVCGEWVFVFVFWGCVMVLNGRVWNYGSLHCILVWYIIKFVLLNHLRVRLGTHCRALELVAKIVYAIPKFGIGS